MCIIFEFFKWVSDEMLFISNGESSKQEVMQKICKNSDIEKIIEDLVVIMFEVLKVWVREFEWQLFCGDCYKCFICMDLYLMFLMFIQCWYVYCEECWLWILGVKKFCFQCNMIIVFGDLWRIYL